MTVMQQPPKYFFTVFRAIPSSFDTYLIDLYFSYNCWIRLISSTEITPTTFWMVPNVINYLKGMAQIGSSTLYNGWLSFEMSKIPFLLYCLTERSGCSVLAFCLFNIDGLGVQDQTVRLFN